MASSAHAPGLLRVIAIEKLLKAAALVVVGIEVLRLGGPNGAALLDHWVHLFHVDPQNHYVHKLLERLLAMNPARLRQLGVGTFIYAGLYVIEGVGLLLDRTWAEWLTIITTAALVPVEVYELARRLTVPRGCLLVFNIAVVAYLIYRLWQKHTRKRG